MSDVAQVQDAVIAPVESQTEALPVEATKAPEARKPGPADDLRSIQNLLINGIFPGNMAPSVVQAFQKLDTMAAKIEQAAANEAEFKARQAL